MRNEERFDKPGEKVSADLVLTIKGKVMPYVSEAA